MCYDIALDTHELEILNDTLFELRLAQRRGRSSVALRCDSGRSYLLLARIGVIKPNDELAVIHLSEVFVEKGSFGMADMQVPRWLGRETRNDMAVDGIVESKSE